MSLFRLLGDIVGYIIHVVMLVVHFPIMVAQRLFDSSAQILMFVFHMPIMVFHWLLDHWSQQTNRQLLLSVPALAGIGSILVLMAMTTAQELTLSADYVKEARHAGANKDYILAELLLTRALRRGGDQLSDAQFAMAVLLDESGQKKRAAELFAMLAPDDRRGNSDAHRRLAGILSDHITPHSDAADVKRLYWHLTMATDSTSPQISVAWGRYYIAIGDLKSAKTYFQKAVERFPALWKAVGAIEMKLGNRVAAENSFQRSSAYLAEKLEADPKRERIRADYAEVLIMQGRLDEAEIALKNGKLLNPDGSWARLLAALAVSHHDMASTRGTPVSELLRHLDRALEYDPNNAPALSRLMSYSAATVDGNAELRTVLARVIADGKQPALAHVAMGNLCLLEDNQDQAIFHFETAMRLRNDIAMLLNNLAWLLAHEENAPDLKRAMALVNSALEQNPDHPEFLDTRATIFLLQKDWKAALIDLERALDGVRDKKTVHQKLTTVYIELGFNDIAEQHRLLSERPTRIGL